MDVTKVGKAISNGTRVKILRILADSPRSSIETYERYEAKHAEGKHRETIYRELENLVEAGLLTKTYNETASQIEYSLEQRRLLIDLAHGTVEPYEVEEWK
jgi:DNA-binding transcriptional ArsR family regulator